MLSDGVSEHQLLKIFLGGNAPRPPYNTWAAKAAVAAFGGASAPPTPKLLPSPMGMVGLYHHLENSIPLHCYRTLALPLW